MKNIFPWTILIALFIVSANLANGQIISTYAGNGTPGFSGDGGPATSAALHTVWGIGIDGSSNVYFADINNFRIRMVNSSTGVITTIGGNGVYGFSGDGGAATAASISIPTGVAVFGSNLYFIDYGNARVRRINLVSGIITTAAGNGFSGHAGDGGPATAAAISGDNGIAVDQSGNIYLAEQYTNYIRKITMPAGTISTIAGTGVAGWSPDGTPALSTNINDPQGIAVDAAGNVYYSELANHLVRKIDIVSGNVTTVAGTHGVAGYGGDGSAATAALLHNPGGLDIDGAGNLYICDASNQRLRKVNSAGIISTFAGNGTPGFSGDGGLATLAEVDEPDYVAHDAYGNIYLGDQANNRMRKIAPTVSVITGPSTVCVGSTITLSDATPGGTWSSSNTTIATIGSASGVVTGVVTGVDTISYITISGTATTIITVNPNPAPISGTSGICLGLTTSTTYYDATPGGWWSSNYTTIAIIGPISGVVIGVAPGCDTITYTLPTGCYTTHPLCINPSPAPISGVAGICVGTTTTLTDATPGGTWSASNGHASVGSTSGVVLGLTSGVDTIIYTLGGCSATRVITVNPTPAPITGDSIIYISPPDTLSDATPGGVWSSSFVGVTYIDPVTGVAQWVSLGCVTIKYTVGGCYDSFRLCGNPLQLWNVTGGGSYCGGDTGVHIGLSSSSPSYVSYELFRGGTSTGIILAGTTGPLDFGLQTVPGTYTVVASYLGFIRTMAGSATITINPTPSSISGLNIVCPGSSITLTDTTAGGTWSASNGHATVGTTGVVTGVTAGTDTIRYTNSYGCAARKIITVNSLPTISAGAGVTICPGSSTTITATGGTTYTWSPATGLSATTGATVTASPTVTTTYTITGTTAGCSGTTTKTVTIGASLTISTGPGVAICSGSSATLTATGGTTYTWSPSTGLSATTGATVVASPTATITYTITGAAGGCSGTGVKTVSVNALPIIAAGTGVTICSGSSATLTATGATTYTWSPGTGLSATTGATVGASPTATITYTVTGTTAGCNGRATKTVSVNPSPTISAGAGITICSGTSTTLTATGGTTYTWSPGTGLSATTGATVGASPTATTTYTVTGTTAGCSGTAIKTVTIGGSLTISAGPDIAICIGSSATLTATGGTTYTWSPATGLSATTGATIVASPTATTTYTITGTTGGCHGTGTKTVSVNALPVISAGAGTSICIGSSTTLTASGGTTYTWSPATGLSATTGATVGASPAATTTYTVTGTTAGCNGSATNTVTVNATPTISAGPDITICAGTSATLTATGGTTYTWSPGTGLSATTGTTVVARPAATITYTVTGTTGAGCSGVATKAVTVSTITGTITGSPTICQGATTTLTDAAPGGVWTSSNTAIATVGTSTGIVHGVSAGMVTITYTTGAGCRATWPMTVNPLPSNITGPTSVMCLGRSITLSDATTGGMWSSSNISIATVTTTGVVTGVAGGSATISYTLTTGCAAVRNVSVMALPPITGLHNMCAWGDTVTIHDSVVTGLYSSTLVTAVNLGGGAALVTSYAAGIGTVTYTLPSGCYVTATMTTNPLPGLITGANHTYVGGTTTLSNIVAGGTWSSGSPGIASVGSATGIVTGVAAGTAYITYTLPVTGCKADTPVHVTAHKPGQTTPSTIMQGTGEGTINVIPNPNKGEFVIRGTLNTTADEEVAIELTDMLGQVVYKSKVLSHEGRIEEEVLVGNIANGMYLLSVRSSEEKRVMHIVVSR